MTTQAHDRHLSEASDAGVRLAELLGSLSLGVDLGFGQPMEHVLRQCVIGLRVAERLALSAEARVNVFYTALMVNVGCHTDAHEQAKWFGDDVALKAGKYEHRLGSMSGAVASLKLLGSGRPPLDRFKIALEFAIAGHRDLSNMIEQHAEMARSLAEQLGLPAGVLDAVAASYEQWDGRGFPGKLAAEQVPLPSRIAQLAEFLEVAHRTSGIAGARAIALERRGKQFDPGLVDLISSDGNEIFEDLEEAGAWDAVMAADPANSHQLSGDRLDAALVAIATFVDLKSPYFLGHSVAVSELVAGAAREFGLSEVDVRTLRRAGLVHDFGRLGISNGILDKRRPLGAADWERLRLQPYLTERMLKQSHALAPLGAIAISHRERLDGSGYPRGVPGSFLNLPVRLLGAADAYQSMREPRPHRPPLDDDKAASQLRAEVRGGRLDATAVEAVLAAAGHRVLRRREGAAGLTSREVEILRLLARGLSNKEIAARLVVSRKTVSNHVEHIYQKIDARNRAAAGFFAMRQGLLPEEEMSLKVAGPA